MKVNKCNTKKVRVVSKFVGFLFYNEQLLIYKDRNYMLLSSHFLKLNVKQSVKYTDTHAHTHTLTNIHYRRQRDNLRYGMYSVLKHVADVTPWKKYTTHSE